MDEEYEKNGYTIEISDGGFSILYDGNVIATDYFEWDGAVDDSDFEAQGKLLIIGDPERIESHSYTIQLKQDGNGTRCLINGKVLHTSEQLDDGLIDFESYTQKDE
ncbi:MAG: hypothetical protein GVY36_12700 [Verrucomicrobia bacterium]|jgi:hypothetical protein|nr:hypothetical protein [Verrucomicrobiota bacterium]